MPRDASYGGSMATGGSTSSDDPGEGPVSVDSSHVAVVGAGPYGLATAAQLRRRGIDVRVLGQPMSFWRTMPAGMLLRSSRAATNMIELHGEHSIDAFERATKTVMAEPIPLERFVAYGEWVQARVVPDVEDRRVTAISRRGDGFLLETEDGRGLEARRVVVAAGIEPFPHRPATFAALEPELASHTADHSDYGRFAGARVAVVGRGQSALESAALLAERGASVEVLIRAARVVWLHGGKTLLGALGPVFYAPTDVGPLWYSRLVSVPGMFRRLPRRAQGRIAARCIRPAGAPWLADRLGEVTLTFGRSVAAARAVSNHVELRLDDATTRRVDHVLLGTGYEVDIAKYDFLPPELLGNTARSNGFPRLGPGLESSVPCLHFLGAPAAWSFGPIMRFVSGSWFASRVVADFIVAADRRRRRIRSAGASPVPEG
jgi:hypothetical protein